MTIQDSARTASSTGGDTFSTFLGRQPGAGSRGPENLGPSSWVRHGVLRSLPLSKLPAG